MVIVIFYIAFALFRIFAKAVGLDKVIPILFSRQKPLQQKREDYDALFIHDIKRGAKRNKVPSRLLYVMDPNDWEDPWIFYGKVIGINLEGDVSHIAIRRRFRIFSDILFLPRDRMTDPNTKELFAFCAGFRPVNRWYWKPIWPSHTVNTKERERLRGIVDEHLEALYHEFGQSIFREESLAQTISAMEPSLVAKRVPPIAREPEPVQVPKVQGEESVE